MIVHKSWLITIDFALAEDLLSAELPSATDYGLLELARALDMVADHVVAYDAKNLLLDFIKAEGSNLKDQEYRNLIWEFLMKIANTRLRRFAWVHPSTSSYGDRAVTMVNEAFQQIGSPIEFLPFPNKTSALRWLSDPSLPLLTQTPSIL